MTIERVEARAITVPTERPESDGTLEWDSTTIVVVELEADGERGLGYTYSHAVAAQVVESKLAPLVRDADPLAPPATWAAMPSSRARTRCPRPLLSLMPVKDAVACASHQGAARPASAGTHSTPPLQSPAEAETASSWSAAGTKPRSMAHRTAEAAV